MNKANQRNLREKSYQLIKPSYPLAPYWTSELYSKGKYLREYGYYPFFLPLCVNSSHGVGEYSSPQLHELESDAPAQLFFSKKALKKWKKITTKPAYIIITPEIYYRTSRKIKQNKNAKGTIYFPVHSTPSFQDQLDHSKLIKTIKKIPEKFQPVDVCLHSHDIKKNLHLLYIKEKIRVVSAGDASDYRFIKRFYNILKEYKFSMSNGIGSYLFYSIEMGVPFSLVGPDPKLLNISDENFEKGKIRSDHLNPDFQKTSNLFKGYYSKISNQQFRHVKKHLGILYTISRFQLSIVLYKSFFCWILSPKKIYRFSKQSALILINKILNNENP